MIKIQPTALFQISSENEHNEARRTIGILLGSRESLLVTDSYSIPFAEEKDARFCYADVSYAKKMFDLKKKVDENIEVVGWYSTADSVRQTDAFVHSVLSSLIEDGFLLLVDVDGVADDKPIRAFTYQNTQNKTAFVLEAVAVETTAPEEIGIEQLLRLVGKDTQTETLQKNVEEGNEAVLAFDKKLQKLSKYLNDVAVGALLLDPAILEKAVFVVERLAVMRDVEQFVRDKELEASLAIVASKMARLTALLLENNK